MLCSLDRVIRVVVKGGEGGKEGCETVRSFVIFGDEFWWTGRLMMRGEMREE